MATYRMTERPKSSIVTMTFDYYNEALAFCAASKALNPSKPYKVGVEWKVSFTRPDVDRGTYVRVSDWHKPFPSYDEWRGVEGLYHLPVYVPQPKSSQH